MASAGGLLYGKVAVITGAGRGMGRSMAELFVREGARVLVVDISGMEQDVAAAIGANAVAFNCDVSRDEQVEAMFEHAIRVFGRIDALINVAGTLAHRGSDITLEEYEQLTAVNLRGLLSCCTHGVRAMVRAGGGAILNISTVGALNDEQNAPAAYSAAKAGVNALTRSFAVDYGRYGIRVNAMASGITFTEQHYRRAPPEMLRMLSAKAAMGRAAECAEQSEMAAFLVSDRASFVTGAIIPVDGGWSARLA